MPRQGKRRPMNSRAAISSIVIRSLRSVGMPSPTKVHLPREPLQETGYGGGARGPMLSDRSLICCAHCAQILHRPGHLSCAGKKGCVHACLPFESVIRTRTYFSPPRITYVAVSPTPS